MHTRKEDFVFIILLGEENKVGNQEDGILRRRTELTLAEEEDGCPTTWLAINNNTVTSYEFSANEFFPPSSKYNPPC